MGSALTISCAKTWGVGDDVMGRGTTDLGKDTANINLTFIFLVISLISSIIVGVRGDADD